MSNLRLFNVAPAIPPELEFLEKLAHNMWWCWNSDAIELYRRIDPLSWHESNHNPLHFLSRLPQAQLEALVDDEGYMAHYEQVRDRFEAEVLDGAHDTPADCIAYFSLEYGIHESIRLYSGGLGVLAGDYLKSASDMRLPLVAVGLMYRCGYFQQLLNDDGWQQEACPENEINEMPLKRAIDSAGRDIEISLPLPNGVAKAVVWHLQVGRVPLFLLDTNIPENPPHLREITWQLYQADRAIRLRQELLLGIGGYQALLDLGYEPAACHINEGHAAFMSLARISHLMRDKGFDLAAAREIVHRTNVFTTHTPVPAGNETFAVDLVKPHLEALGDRLLIAPDEIVSWGQPAGSDPHTPLSMTVLGFKTADFRNGVSKLHGRVARKMWAHLWPGVPEDELPIDSITNGVHVSSWLSSENAMLYDRYLGREWRDNPSSPDVLTRIEKIPDEELWRVHQINRSRLIRTAREQGEKQCSLRNAPKAQIASVRSVLNHDTLTVGFARRFAAYKRATLLFRDPARLEALINHADRPIQFIFAGKAHPADNIGKDLIRHIIRFSTRSNVRDRMIFLEDYDIRIGRSLVEGVDIWLNTPLRPHEASGTSGMKACMNGAIHLSVLDGWWDEGYSADCGWAIGRREEYENAEYQDDVESQSLYNLLENEVAPRFYDRSDGDIPGRWTGMMKTSIRMALSYFSGYRMLSEYHDLFYRPAVDEYRKLLDDGARRTHTLVSQSKRLKELWRGVTVQSMETDHDLAVLHVGDSFRVKVIVNLGQLTPEEVDVQVYHGPVSAGNRILKSHAETMSEIQENGNGTHAYSHTLTCQASGRYGFTARAVPRGNEWRRGLPGFIAWADGK